MLTYGPAVLIIFSVFVGILLNRRDVVSLRDEVNRQISDLRADINRRFAEMDRRFDRVDARLALIEGDQKQFFVTTGRLDGRIDELAKK